LHPRRDTNSALKYAIESPTPAMMTATKRSSKVIILLPVAERRLFKVAESRSPLEATHLQ
jgi:hypothetical protein